MPPLGGGYKRELRVRHRELALEHLHDAPRKLGLRDVALGLAARQPHQRVAHRPRVRRVVGLVEVQPRHAVALLGAAAHERHEHRLPVARLLAVGVLQVAPLHPRLRKRQVAVQDAPRVLLGLQAGVLCPELERVALALQLELRLAVLKVVPHGRQLVGELESCDELADLVDVPRRQDVQPALVVVTADGAVARGRALALVRDDAREAAKHRLHHRLARLVRQQRPAVGAQARLDELGEDQEHLAQVVQDARALAPERLVPGRVLLDLLGGAGLAAVEE
ncbi:MAG: hypothetical protein CL844_05650, partial [Crocinitomicaceae bacterium]|nr:hypothetical protein [Crocinitomicaceae bacterium]